MGGESNNVANFLFCFKNKKRKGGYYKYLEVFIIITL